MGQRNLQKTTVKISPYHTSGAFLQLPDDYSSTNKKYPLILFLHGKSKSGSDLDKLTLEGIPFWLDKGLQLSAVNPVDKQLYKFITIAPQALNWGLSPAAVNQVLNDVIARYRVDVSRIYITGYSAGGWATMMAITDNQQLTSRFAAAVPMSPANIEDSNLVHFKMIAKANLHCWYFAGSAEPHYLENVQRYIDSTNKYKTGLTRLTDQQQRHCCWKQFYDPHFKEKGMNIYEWMLQYKQGQVPVTPARSQAATK
ncbi:prolyl oligopeptidase family serine peptidase [Chitinophaga nivalis]|uniref:Prolyl oligopeptidase family serine peptidase n=1 Tax=Chitinophaga nivalis TaxID=2991709 RepID=A0ABT3ILT6_9BACT|nr:prolyl oligopeptidase family serine peptidase [Chitinophaga nivalis]MCW3465405.1 prolyl oligopeptidase family serine peptidase [Chitinophaga nivalis]MCW3484903.1 prolyl oligopeptidase family serine peptidase [Chitinophaga nivalis]